MHKSKNIKVKDRPFAEGSRGCHAPLFVDQPLSARERHVILPLRQQPLLCSLSLLFFAITSSYNAQFSLTLNALTLLEAIFIALFAPMTTYLKDLTQSIGRYGGLLKEDLGLRVFGCTSSISTWCGIFGQQRQGASTTCWKIYDNITSMWI